MLPHIVLVCIFVIVRMNFFLRYVNQLVVSYEMLSAFFLLAFSIFLSICMLWLSNTSFKPSSYLMSYILLSTTRSLMHEFVL